MEREPDVNRNETADLPPGAHVAIPAGYIERAPRRGPWQSPSVPPLEGETVQILLVDGTTDHATWTNGLWWSHREQHPVGWRRMEDLSMDTRKLR